MHLTSSRSGEKELSVKMGEVIVKIVVRLKPQALGFNRFIKTGSVVYDTTASFSVFTPYSVCHFPVCLFSPDLLQYPASLMTMPSSSVGCWICTRPRCRWSGWSGQRSCSSGRMCSSLMNRVEATSAAIPATALYSCSSKRVKDAPVIHK